LFAATIKLEPQVYIRCNMADLGPLSQENPSSQYTSSINLTIEYRYIHTMLVPMFSDGGSMANVGG
jgi:hypothetical protein